MKSSVRQIVSILSVALFCAPAIAAKSTANREICVPQSGDMNMGYFETQCEWNLMQPGADPNPVITLHGGYNVIAECEFSGSDSILYVQGSKHAKIKPLPTPGNRFSFNVDYKAYSSSDDNQNIVFYLNNKHPSYDDILVCRFYTNFVRK